MDKKVTFVEEGNAGHRTMLEIQRCDSPDDELVLFMGPENADGNGESIAVSRMELLKGISYLMENYSAG